MAGHLVKMSARQAQALPLDEFPEAMRLDIDYLVAQPTPPPRWIDLGLAQIPSRAWWEWHWQRGVDPDKRRDPIPATVRQAVYARDGYRCVNCGTTEHLTLDHIVHHSVGGSDTVGNLRTLCRSCNSSRGTKTDDEWLGACS